MSKKHEALLYFKTTQNTFSHLQGSPFDNRSLLQRDRSIADRSSSLFGCVRSKGIKG